MTQDDDRLELEFKQNILIANPENLREKVEVSFIIDTGSSGCAIPAALAKQLKLRTVGEGLAKLADGSTVKTKIAYLYMQVNGEHVFALVSFGAYDSCLLGFDIMHVLGLQVDVQGKRLLKPVRSVKFLGFIFNKRWIGRPRKCRG